MRWNGRAWAGVGQLALYILMFSVWGASFFFTAIALRSFDAYMLPLVRMAIASAALAALVVARGLPWPREWRVYGHALLLGALNIALPYLLLTSAQVHLESSTASVLSATTPLFVFLLSWLVAHTERLSIVRGLGLTMAFLGVASLCLAKGSTTASSTGWALVVVLSSAIFAAGNVYTRRHLPDVNPIIVASLQVGLGTGYLLVANAVTGHLIFSRPTLASALAVLELGLLGSALTYILFFHFIRRWGSTAASLNTYFQPVIGLVLGGVVLDEVISARELLSLAVLFGGILIFGAASIRDVRARTVDRTHADQAHPSPLDARSLGPSTEAV